MTRADTIARHLSVFETHLRTVASGVDVETRTSAVPDAAAALREAFAALDGGAAVAGEANGPPEPAPPDEEPSAEVLAADDSPDEPVDPCARCGQERAHLLHAPISPGALCHGVGPLRDVYAHPFVAAAPTPSPPKPAGWVLHRRGVPYPFVGQRGFQETVAAAVPFATPEEADLRRDYFHVTARPEVQTVPVDAAGGKVEITDCTAEPAMVEGWNDAGGRSVLVRSGVVVASAEWGRPGNWAHWLFPDGRQGGVTTTLDEARAAAEAAFPPEPPKPAGWVIEDRADVQYRWRGDGVRSGGGNWRPLVAEVVPFATESEAREAAKRLAHIDTRVLPVDAAGNVIEAEGIGATLRREECERKAARQSGVAWEAARAGEEAERLRGELAAVKAERDKVLSNAAVLDTSLRRLRTDHATTLAERDALAAEVQRAKEQKPVRWGFLDKTGVVVCTTSAPQPVSSESGYRVAPLYLAPVVRDHSGVIAQCEAYLAGDYELGEPRPGPHDVIAAALAALRGAS